jgi:hypothetical protein
MGKLEALLGKGPARPKRCSPPISTPARLRPVAPEAGLCALAVRTGGTRRARPRQSLPEDDEAAIAELTQIKGIGRWSAEIYLLFAEGRPDIWPAGDLAVQAGLHKLLGLEGRPAKSRRARWPKAGARIAARRRSSPGIIITARRSSR